MNSVVYEFQSIQNTVWNDTSLDDRVLQRILNQSDMYLFAVSKFRSSDFDDFTDFAIALITEKLKFTPVFRELEAYEKERYFASFKKDGNF